MEKSFYKALVDIDTSRCRAVICTLLDWKGSVPRKDYPLMLVLENGKSIGTIGGGVMEHEVIERARRVLENGMPELPEFDLSRSDASGEGGVCGGKTRILIEPFTRESQNFWKELKLSEPGDQDRIVVTEVFEDESVRSRLSRVLPGESLDSFDAGIAGAIREVIESRRSKSFETEKGFCLVRLVQPPPVLHIFGAGHVARAVAELADFIELDYCVYDDRSGLVNNERFPNAKQIVADDFSKMTEIAKISPQDYVLVATRGHRHDLEILRWLLSTEIEYLGLMSSRRKWRILSKALRETGFPTEKLAAVHAPVGLDIHSETVPEIAVSIISEIVNHYRRAKRSRQSLSNG